MPGFRNSSWVEGAAKNSAIFFKKSFVCLKRGKREIELADDSCARVQSQGASFLPYIGPLFIQPIFRYSSRSEAEKMVRKLG
jgi:hypothetical protein